MSTVALLAIVMAAVACAWTMFSDPPDNSPDGML